jgi:Zn-dependent protease with chaperone function
MSSLGERLLPALTAYIATHIVVFTLVSWVVVSSLLGLGLVWVLTCGLTSAFVAVFFEWLLGPSFVSSLLRLRWVEREEDVVLWSLVEAVAEKAGVKVGKVGVLDAEAPNALVFSSATGRPTVVLTKGLLVNLTYAETRAVVAYLLGCSKSGVLWFVTTLSGLLTLSTRIASGYIESSLEEKPVGLARIILAGWGYLIFTLTSPTTTIAGRGMSAYGDEFSIRQVGKPFFFITALLKVTAGIAEKPSDPVRMSSASLKGLMFQDPSSSLRDASAIKEVAEKYEIDLARLLGHNFAESKEGGEPRLHLFERFWVQLGLTERLETAMELGKEAPSISLQV